jgi:hypothetical protein
MGGTVMNAPIAGGSPTTLVSAQKGAFAIAVDSVSIYWTNGVDGGSVMRLAK